MEDGEATPTPGGGSTGSDEPAIVSVETLYSGWTRLLRVALRFPDGGVALREVEDHGAGVAVLAFDPARRTAILVSQARASVLHVTGETATIEAIAGILDCPDPEDCARREAMEEAGLRLGALDRIATVWTVPGVSTERLHLFLAEYSAADRVGPGGGLDAEHERITVVELPLATLDASLAEGQIADAKTLILLQALKLRRPDLFR